MVTPLDVFRDGTEPEWIGWAETLAQALELVRENGPGAYFVLSLETQQKNYYEVNPNGVISPA